MGKYFFSEKEVAKTANPVGQLAIRNNLPLALKLVSLLGDFWHAVLDSKIVHWRSLILDASAAYLAVPTIPHLPPRIYDPATRLVRRENQGEFARSA